MKSPVVLCVDDDDAIRTFYGDLLGEEGYGVLSASSGSQALDLLQSTSHVIEAAILDYQLPGMNGFELAVRLKLHEPNLAILMISSSTPELEEMAPFVDAAMQKGAPIRDILNGIEDLLANRKNRMSA